jgi:hypothetical protein
MLLPELARQPMGRERIIADRVRDRAPRSRHHRRLLVRQEISTGERRGTRGLG